MAAYYIPEYHQDIIQEAPHLEQALRDQKPLHQGAVGSIIPFIIEVFAQLREKAQTRSVPKGKEFKDPTPAANGPHLSSSGRASATNGAGLSTLKQVRAEPLPSSSSATLPVSLSGSQIWTCDDTKKMVKTMVNGKEVSITFGDSQYAVMSHLLSVPGKFVSANLLLEKSGYTDSNALLTLILNVQRYLGTKNVVFYIKVVSTEQGTILKYDETETLARSAGCMLQKPLI